jgi:hypothetical protein
MSKSEHWSLSSLDIFAYTTYADKGIDAARVVYAKMSKEDKDQCSDFVATLKAA